GQYADAERRPGEEIADERQIAQRGDEERLGEFLHEGGEHEEAPDAVDDAGDRREQLDHRAQRPLEPDRTEFGDEDGDAEGDRDADQHGDRRAHQRAVDRRTSAETLLHRVPGLAGDEAPAELLQGGDGAARQCNHHGAENDEYEDGESKRDIAEDGVGDGAATPGRHVRRAQGHVDHRSSPVLRGDAGPSRPVIGGGHRRGLESEWPDLLNPVMTRLLMAGPAARYEPACSIDRRILGSHDCSFMTEAWQRWLPASEGCLQRGSESSPASRSRTVKTDPSPSSLAMSSRPRWRLTICLTIARPSPVPPMARERAVSTR